jgi:hypothetical protein
MFVSVQLSSSFWLVLELRLRGLMRVCNNCVIYTLHKKGGIRDPEADLKWDGRTRCATRCEVEGSGCIEFCALVYLENEVHQFHSTLLPAVKSLSTIDFASLHRLSR